jgi:DNA polymerase-3 subunit epsilon
VAVAGNWAFIDFETATASRSSACALGLVLVDDGVITRRERRLIRPPDNEYAPINVWIHGIRPEDTEGSPDAAEVWAELEQMCNGRLLVAHNAGFDMSVLRHSLGVCASTTGVRDFACTLVLARRVWPELWSWSLPVVAAHVGVSFDHHDPVADAEAAVAVALAAIEKSGSSDLESVFDAYRIAIGTLSGEAYIACAFKGSTKSALSRLEPRYDEIDADNPFYGVTVAFTGALDAMTRVEAAQLVVDAGGRCAASISKKVDVLVTGIQDVRKFAPGLHTSTKLMKFADLRASGYPIEMITERDFLRLLS